MGYNALYNLGSTAAQNTGLGSDALAALNSGSSNTAVGYMALNAISTASNNTSVGWRAGTQVTGGDNTFVGYGSGYTLTSGTFNTLLGHSAGNSPSIGTGSYNILVGQGTNVATANQSYHLNIGGLIRGDLSSGFVGIGTSAPAYQLQVAKADATGTMISVDNISSSGTRFPALAIRNFGGSFGGNPVLSLTNARGTNASPTPTTLGDFLGEIRFNGFGAGPMQTSSIAAVAEETFTGSAGGTALKFGTTMQGSTVLTERMRILGGGNVGIGTPNPAFALTVAGVIAPNTDNAFTLGTSSNRFSTVYATNGTISTSDRRLKKDIESSDLGLAFINDLAPVSYHWIEGDKDVHYGVIAQDTAAAVARAKGISTKEAGNIIVSHDEKSDRFGVKYTELISPLIKAVQEFYAEFRSSQTEMKAELASVKAENAELKSRLDRLEQRIEAKHLIENCAATVAV